MFNCRSFPANADENAEILILGSMPGAESLRQQQYYAYKFNAFWRIAGTLWNFNPELPYPERLAALRRNHVALWDVFAACSRTGSLDTAIRSGVPNDIPGLLKKCPKIRRIGCNGQTAGKALNRFFPGLAGIAVILPSTSPAAAGIAFAEKLARWQLWISGNSGTGFTN